MFAKKIYYTGKVQGVGFRYSTKRIAGGFEVVGWVQNLSDGRVEMLAASIDEDELNDFLIAIKESDLGNGIYEIAVQDVTLDEIPKTFSIR